MKSTIQGILKKRKVRNLKHKLVVVEFALSRLKEQFDKVTETESFHKELPNDVQIHARYLIAIDDYAYTTRYCQELGFTVISQGEDVLRSVIQEIQQLK